MKKPFVSSSSEKNATPSQPSRRRERWFLLLMMLVLGAAIGVSLMRGESADFDLPDLSDVTRVVSADASATQSPTPVESYRADREQTREQTLLALETLSQTAQGDLQTVACAQIEAIVQNSEAELALEGALSAQGFGESVCVVREDNVYLFVQGQLTKEQTALVFDLAQEWTGAREENIVLSQSP